MKFILKNHWNWQTHMMIHPFNHLPFQNAMWTNTAAHMVLALMEQWNVMVKWIAMMGVMRVIVILVSQGIWNQNIWHGWGLIREIPLHSGFWWKLSDSRPENIFWDMCSRNFLKVHREQPKPYKVMFWTYEPCSPHPMLRFRRRLPLFGHFFPF